MLLKSLRLSIFSFLFTSTFSGINFFFGNENSYISGNFSKFSSIIFSLSDLFLFLSMFLFLFFLYKTSFLEKNKILNFLHIKENILENFSDKKFNFLFFGLILSSFITSFFIENFSDFLLHFSILIKFFSAGFLIFYLPEKIFSKKEIINTLIFSFVIQSFIVFYQVIFQKPVGLFFLGENNFGENILGLAKISLENGEKFIRGYGTLAHPNILGLGSLILYFLAGKSGYKFLKNFLLIGIFFSFSKTAIIGFFILKIYEKFILENNLNKISDFTFLKIFFKNKFKILYLFFYSSIFLAFSYFFGEKIFLRFLNFFGSGFEERILQFEISKNIFLENLFNLNFFGIGFGNFTIQMQNFSSQILKPWEIQPVHNIFVLFGIEVGFLGFLILISLISYIFIKSTSFFSFFTRKKTIKNQNNEKFFLILILFFTSFFDHFLLTSGVGIILFWLILKKIKD